MTTDFSYNGKQILSDGPFKPNGKDMPNDARTRVECYADIATIPNPYVGLKITVKVDETNNNKMTDYIVKSLKANSLGAPNSAINEVVRYADYLGVSDGSSGSGSGAGLTDEERQNLSEIPQLKNTVEEHTQIINILQGNGSTGVVNEWSGKKASFLGDSITFGINTTKTYHQYLKEIMGFSVCNNYGIDGSTITDKSNGICTRYNNVASDSDIIFIFGGTNDFFHNKQLGEWYTLDRTTRVMNNDISTFRGALAVICNGLITKFPTKQIVLLTPLHRSTFGGQPTDLQTNQIGLYLENYVECVKEAGRIFGIPVIDLNGESGLYPINAENANVYFHENDKLHPNANGHLKIAKTIQGKLKTILPVDIDYTPNVYGDIVLSKTSITIDEGASSTFTVKLDKAPTNSQTVNISSNNSDVTLSASVLTFNSSNYSAPQTVTINVAEDSDATNDNCTLTLSSNNVPSKTIAVTITDNDSPSTTDTYGNIVVSKSTITINEGSTDTFTVVLDKAPTNSQVVTLSVDNTDVTLSTNTLTFTSDNYNQTQTVTINVAEDADTANDTCTITLSSSSVADKTVVLTINDTTIASLDDLTGKSYKLTYNGSQGWISHVVFVIPRDADCVSGATLNMKFDINNAVNYQESGTVNTVQVFNSSTPEVNNGVGTEGGSQKVNQTTIFSNGSASIDFNFTLANANNNYLKIPYGLKQSRVPSSIDISNIGVTVNGISKPIVTVGAFFTTEQCVVSEL